MKEVYGTRRAVLSVCSKTLFYCEDLRTPLRKLVDEPGFLLRASNYLRVDLLIKVAHSDVIVTYDKREEIMYPLWESLKEDYNDMINLREYNLEDVLFYVGEIRMGIQAVDELSKTFGFTSDAIM